MELDRSNQKCDVLDYMSSSGSRDIGRFSVFKVQSSHCSALSLSLCVDLLVVQFKHALKRHHTLRCDTLWHGPNAFGLDCAHMHVVVCLCCMSSHQAPLSVKHEEAAGLNF